MHLRFMGPCRERAIDQSESTLLEVRNCVIARNFRFPPDRPRTPMARANDFQDR